MNQVGAPSISGSIQDNSNTSQGVPKGRAIVFGQTLWGEIGGTPKLVKSPSEFIRYFGGEVSYSKFPMLVIRALKRGAQLYVGRVGHYSDASDADTLTADKATKTGTTNTGLTINARYHGEGGNLITVALVSPKSGKSGVLDLELSISGYSTIVRAYRDFPTTPSASDVAKADEALEFVNLVYTTGTLAAESLTLAAGDYDESSIVAADYAGDSGAGTGIHAAGNVMDASRIACPEIAEPTVDIAMVAFCAARQDMRAILRTPVSLGDTVVINYREGTGSYSHTPIDSWYASLWTGGLITKDENGTLITHSELADVLAAYALKDNIEHPSRSVSALPWAMIKDALDVSYNYKNPSKASEFDNIYNVGVNAVVNEPQTGICLYGNKTLYKTQSLLQKDNIAEFVVYFWRTIKPQIRLEQFQPDDPKMWLSLFMRIDKILREGVENRAIRPDYLYEGDQFVDDYQEVTYNTIEDINAGAYKFRIALKPISATEYIEFVISVVDSQASFEVQTITNL